MSAAEYPVPMVMEFAGTFHGVAIWAAPTGQEFDSMDAVQEVLAAAESVACPLTCLLVTPSTVAILFERMSLDEPPLCKWCGRGIAIPRALPLWLCDSCRDAHRLGRALRRRKL